MRPPRAFILYAASVLLLLGACSPAAQPRIVERPSQTVHVPKRVTVTERDDGRVVRLRVGDTLAVVLASNPSTGYAWAVGCLARGVLQRAGEVQARPKTGLLGTGGERLFLFDAARRGRTRVCLAYRRPFEQEEPATTFRLTVVVK